MGLGRCSTLASKAVSSVKNGAQDIEISLLLKSTPSQARVAFG